MLKKLFTVRNLVILLGVIALFVISGLLGLEVPAPEVFIAAEPIFHIGDFAVTNALFTTWIVMIILIVIALITTRRYPKEPGQGREQRARAQRLRQLHRDGGRGAARAGSKRGGQVDGHLLPHRDDHLPHRHCLQLDPASCPVSAPSAGWSIRMRPKIQGYVANGIVMTAEPAPPGEGVVLVPFFRAPSTDLNFTLALALIAVFLSQYFGVKTQKLGYFKKFFDISGFKQGAMMGVIMVFVGLLELIAEFARIISFSFRLFGNVFAGEVLLLVMAFLIPYIASLPFYGLELFVGFIQALVFMMLALVFFTLATQGHGSEEHH